MFKQFLSFKATRLDKLAAKKLVVVELVSMKIACKAMKFVKQAKQVKLVRLVC